MGISHYWSAYVISAGDFSFETTVTHSGDVADDWVGSVLSMAGGDPKNTIVGVGMEWVPSGAPSASGIPGKMQLAVLQLCVGRRCLVFQLLHCDHLPQNLSGFLKDDRFCFLGVGIISDFKKLSNQFPSLMVGDHVHDLRDLAAERMCWQQMRWWALKDLVREIIQGMSTEKPIQVINSNWGQEVLTHEQIQYASLDVFASYEVGKKLLFDMDRLVYEVGQLQLAGNS